MFHVSMIRDGALVAALAAAVSYVFSFASTALAHRINAVDQPRGGRKIHTRPIPLLGGVGIAFTILLGIGALFATSWFTTLGGVRPLQLVGVVVGILMVLAVGILDEVRDLRPGIRFSVYALAAAVIILTGTGIVQVTRLGGGALSMAWFRWGVFTFPSDLLTLAWLLVVMFATKVSDGLDGLVTGQTVLSSGIIAALSFSAAYYQPSVAILACLVAGAFLGFLPRNVNPARQFLGESGSVLAGFLLAVLSVISSAKVATALAVLAVPVVDFVFVVVGRLRRGVSPMQGDDTHLHFRLLRAGLSQRSVVFLLWTISLLAGLLALGLQTRGKLLLLGALVIVTALLSWASGWRSRRKV